ncbi:MAG: peptidylprolyl isomerase [Clostridia bacterium]|nr:peptidylprolyl isomerase [Clostridia bacterium]
MKNVIVKAVSLLLALTICLTAAVSAAAGETGATESAAPAAVSANDLNGDGKLTAADVREMLLAPGGEQALPEAKKQLRALLGSSENASPTLANAGVGLYDRVITANGRGYTAAEFSYFYNSIFFNTYQQAYYYDYSYGEGYGKLMTGFDYTLSPEEQYTQDDDGNKITFAEAFRQMAVSAIEQYAYFCSLAEQAGKTLDEEDESYLTESIASAEESALNYDMTLDQYIEAQFGEGVNAFILTKIMRDQLLAQKYEDSVTEDTKNGITDEQIEAYYNENKNSFNTVSGRLFRLTVTYNDDGTTDAEAQQKVADDFIAGIKTEEDFISGAAQLDPDTFSSEDSTKISGIDYDTFDQYISSDAAEWCFDAARKTGDIASFATTQYIYVIYLTGLAGRNEDRLPSVRHLLVTYEEDYNPEDGATAPAESDYRSKEEARKLAEQYLAEFNKSDKTEASFAALADEHSDDTASTTAGGGEGGLYADVEKGQFVQQFEEWAYDESRKAGDTGIIETQFGYHVMYFVGLADEPAWKTEIRDTLGQEKAEEKLEEMNKQFAGSAVFEAGSLDAVCSYTLDVILSAMM